MPFENPPIFFDEDGSAGGYVGAESNYDDIEGAPHTSSDTPGDNQAGESDLTADQSGKSATTSSTYLAGADVVTAIIHQMGDKSPDGGPIILELDNLTATNHVEGRYWDIHYINADGEKGSINIHY